MDILANSQICHVQERCRLKKLPLLHQPSFSYFPLYHHLAIPFRLVVVLLGGVIELPPFFLSRRCPWGNETTKSYQYDNISEVEGSFELCATKGYVLALEAGL